MNTPLDHDAYVNAWGALIHARVQGLDAVEELHRRGLLLTVPVRKLIRVDAIRVLSRDFYSYRPAEFMRRKYLPSHPGSPKDMYVVVGEWLEGYVKRVESEE